LYLRNFLKTKQNKTRMAQAPTTSEDVVNARFEEIKKMGYVSQTNFFVNVQWEALDETDKHTIASLLAKFNEQTVKFAAKENQLAYPQFCKVLQQMEDKNPHVQKALKEAGDRSTMGKRFQELGFKLRGDVTLLESCLFLFSVSVSDVTTKPASPCEATLRRVTAELATLESDQKALLDKKANYEREMKEHQDNNKPMKVMQVQQELKKVDDQIQNTKVEYQKKLKAANKAVAEAEQGLQKEKSDGTVASKWLRGVCDEHHMKYSQY